MSCIARDDCAALFRHGGSGNNGRQSHAPTLTTRAGARHWLRQLALENGLCTIQLGLDERSADPACPARRTGHCRGACLGKETADAHFQRAAEAIAPHRIAAWPYPSILLVEHDGAFHVLDHWRYLGLAKDAGEIPEIVKNARVASLAFDAQLYEAWQHHTGAAQD